jgi:hypothetical protein
LSELAQEVDLSELFPDDKLNELLEQLGRDPVSSGNNSPESSTQEIDTDEFEFECTCPKCGFQFNK